MWYNVERPITQIKVRSEEEEVESNRRNVWIVIVVVLVAACCCVLVLAAAAAGWFTGWSFDWGEGSGYERERIEKTYEVGRAPSLEIDNFAGSISVRAGERDTIQVVATKQARRLSNLERIEIEMIEREGGLLIRTRKPLGLANVSVQLEIVVPTDTRLDAHTGSGSVDVHGLSGGVQVDTGSGGVEIGDLSGGVDVHTGSGSVEVRNLAGDLKVRTGSGSIEMDGVTGAIDAHTGSGGIKVRGAEGLVLLDTGSGSIQYEGTPEGDCRFETGSGSITLAVPADLNMEVDLDTGSGTVDLDFTVKGEVTKREARGVIGDGSRGSIYAHTGSGGVELIRK